ncbi:hypothetical protein LguiB_029417 [Lonicera macranthoides]
MRDGVPEVRNHGGVGCGVWALAGRRRHRGTEGVREEPQWRSGERTGGLGGGGNRKWERGKMKWERLSAEFVKMKWEQLFYFLLLFF